MTDSTERAGVYTSSALNREAARAMVAAEFLGSTPSERLLDALESCVVPDPRITRIEALLDDPEQTFYRDGEPGIYLDALRAALRGDQ